MNHKLTLRLLLVAMAVASVTARPAAGNTLSWLVHNDVVYLSPAQQGWEGLPLGNGTLGAQAWQPDALVFQLNTPWGGALGTSIGRVRLRTTPGLLNDVKNYRQRLALTTATLITEIDTATGPVQIKAWISAGADVLVIEVNDGRTNDVETTIELETWHPKTAQHRALPAGLLLMDHQVADYPCALASGFVVPPAGGIQVEPPRMRSTSKRYTLLAAFAGSRDPQADVAGQAQTLLERYRKEGIAKLRADHEAWWAQFWSRSYVQLTGPEGTADYLANLWYMHLYAMAAGSRGDVPPKFNGGLWLHDKDEREWGTGYWHWNTQETYWPLYAANHLDLLDPYYRTYFAMLPKVKQETMSFFGVDGAHYAEVVVWDGTDATGKSEKVTGRHPRLPVPKVINNGNWILSSSAEVAMQFWWRYLYTGDRTFLQDRAYPVMRAVADFYVAFLEKDDRGRYNMDPSNAHETFLGVKNPATDLAALRYLFPTLIKASELLGVDAELRPVWRDRLDHLAPWHINPETGAIASYEFQPGVTVGRSNAENPDVFPMGVFPLIKLGSPDLALGVRTFRARTHVNVYGWTTDSIAAARLGLRDDMAKLLPGHADLYQDHPSGLMDYYTRTPAVHPYLEGSGTFATGLGEMLLQSWPATPGETDPILRVCPALPAGWDARFKLLAMGGFEVECVAEQGQPRTVAITSTRGGTARVANPFGKETVVTHNEREVLKSADEVLKFPTEAGRTYFLTVAGEKPVKLGPLALPANAAPKQLKPGSRRWLGKTEAQITRWKPPVEPNAPQPPALPAAVERPANPAIKPVRFAAPPTVDGELDDACWKGVAPIGSLFLLNKKEWATQPTDVRMGYDNANLYLGIVCWEARMSNLSAEFEAHPNNRDAGVYADDAVELFIQPGSGPYWHLAVNVLGAMYDARVWSKDKNEPGYNPAWQVATSRKSNRWLVEAAIPFQSLAAVAPMAGTSWGFNICRDERPSKETSTWAPLTVTAFHVPEQFGRLLFSEDLGAKWPAVEQPGLVGYWSGESLAGQWVGDGSGHGHHAFAFGAVKPAQGKSGAAIELAGGSLVIDDADELNLGETFTLALWVFPKSVGSMRLVDKGTAGGSDAYLLDTHPQNNLRFLSQGGSFQSPVTLPTNAWSHVAVVRDQHILRLYLNGQVLEEKTGLQGTPTPNTLPLRIGADSNGGSNFQGLIDDVRIYRRALTPTELGSQAPVNRQRTSP